MRHLPTLALKGGQCQAQKWGSEGLHLWLDGHWPRVHKMDTDRKSSLSPGVKTSGLCPYFLITDQWGL